METKILLKIILFFVLLMVIRFCTSSLSPSCEETLKIIYKKEFNGTVTQKFKDSTMKGFPKLFISDGNTNKSLRVVHSIESRIWGMLSPGDSVYKKINSYEYTTIIKGNKEYHTCKCPEL
jgi:hypothetical protein